MKRVAPRSKVAAVTNHEQASELYTALSADTGALAKVAITRKRVALGKRGAA